MSHICANNWFLARRGNYLFMNKCRIYKWLWLWLTLCGATSFECCSSRIYCNRLHNVVLCKPSVGCIECQYSIGFLHSSSMKTEEYSLQFIHQIDVDDAAGIQQISNYDLCNCKSFSSNFKCSSFELRQKLFFVHFFLWFSFQCVTLSGTAVRTTVVQLRDSKAKQFPSPPVAATAGGHKSFEYNGDYRLVLHRKMFSHSRRRRRPLLCRKKFVFMSATPATSAYKYLRRGVLWLELLVPHLNNLASVETRMERETKHEIHRRLPRNHSSLS